MAQETGAQYLEGPHRYTFDDVPTAFVTALGRPMRLETIPRQPALRINPGHHGRELVGRLRVFTRSR